MTHHYIQLTGDVILFLLNCLEIIISIDNKLWMDEPLVFVRGHKRLTTNWNCAGFCDAILKDKSSYF